MKKEYYISAAITLLVLIVFYFVWLKPALTKIQPISDLAAKSGNSISDILNKIDQIL
jgi:hypothetical protein